ncbi:MAG: hypothetical protein M1450_01785 [Patescibacteria group bacterium]|nr:hypothetical protein [Patescibacteria group bacterium]
MGQNPEGLVDKLLKTKFTRREVIEKGVETGAVIAGTAAIAATGIEPLSNTAAKITEAITGGKVKLPEAPTKKAEAQAEFRTIRPGVEYSQTMTDSLARIVGIDEQIWKDAGMSNIDARGIFKGMVRLNGTAEIALFERCAIKEENGTAVRQSLFRDLTYEAGLQLNATDYFQFNEDEKKRIREMQVFGEPGSETPNILDIRKLLTLQGDENTFAKKTGIVNEILGKDGSVSPIVPGVPEVQFSTDPYLSYQNKHNVPSVFVDYQRSRYGQNGILIERNLGLPISEPYWTIQMTDKIKQWTLVQLFERGSMTHSQIRGTEIGITGNILIYALTGELNPQARGGAENPVDKLLNKDTTISDSVSTTLNGKEYTVETRKTFSTSAKVVIDPALKPELMRLVSQDGEQNGFTKAEFIILGSKDEIPPGVVNSSLNYKYNGAYRDFGQQGSQKYNNTVILYFAPNLSEIPFNDQSLMDNLRITLTSLFLTTTLSGGEYWKVENLPGKTDYINLMKQKPFQLTP